MSDLTEFLLARIAEDETAAKAAGSLKWQSWNRSWDIHTFRDIAANGERLFTVPMDYDEHVARHNPARVLAECEAKRRIVAFHEAWPVLVETPIQFEKVTTDPSEFAYRASQRIQWLTTQEYRARFDDEPPTAPMLLALAAVYADHPDYRQEWKP